MPNSVNKTLEELKDDFWSGCGVAIDVSTPSGKQLHKEFNDWLKLLKYYG